MTKKAKMEAILSSIINNLSQAILILNNRGEIIYTTGYIKNILGYDGTELLGKSSFDLLHLANKPKIKLQYERIITNRHLVLNSVLMMKHKDGRIIWAELTATNLLHDKHIRGVLVTAKNLVLTNGDKTKGGKGLLQYKDIYNEVIDKFNKLVQKNFTKEHHVQYYADALHMHPNRLNFLVKKYTGFTAKQTIINGILIEAKQLLNTSSLTVKEIAYKLGFEDPNYFSAFFQKRIKLSPIEYRRIPV